MKAFRPFQDLVETKRYGTQPVLACRSCNSEYLGPMQGPGLLLLAGRERALFYGFYEEANRVSPKTYEVLQSIGSTTLGMGQFDFPVAVTCKDGTFKKYCVIRLMKTIWPPAFGAESLLFLSSVQEVLVSPQAMTLEQRTAASQVPERGMGYAPFFLQKGEQVFRIPSVQSFIPEKAGRPEDFTRLQGREPDEAPWLGHVPVELFLGRMD